MSAGRFDARGPEDVVSLIDENPLVWLLLDDADGPFATAAPVRPVVSGDRLQGVVGHVPLRSRAAGALATPREVLILVAGPHGYVSPSWMSDRTQAPTWNYAAAQLVAGLRTVEDAAFLEAHLRDLVDAVEGNRRDAWGVDEMGPRFDRLAARIVAFEGTIKGCTCRFKLGQDENDETFAEIARGLTREGQHGLLRWMKRFNPGRG